MIELSIYRKGELIVTVKPSEGSSQTKQVMGDNVVTLNFELNHMVNFMVGDYCTVYDEMYYLARDPTVQKNSIYNYVYDMQMLSSQYIVSKAQMMFYDSNNQLKEGDFSLTGNAEMFIDLLIKNVNRIDSGWQKGAVISSGTKTITFSKTDCASALSQIAEAFNTEFYIEGKRINLNKLSNATPYKFYYGRGKGLYTIVRKQAENTNVITRLYAFGSDKNLPPDYPSSRLRLPGGYDYQAHNVSWTVEAGNTIDSLPTMFPMNTIVITFDEPLSGQVSSVDLECRYKGNSSFNTRTSAAGVIKVLCLKSEILEGRIVSKNSAGTIISATALFEITPVVNSTPTAPIFSETTALPYLQKNTEMFGIIEANYINDDIYPHRTGKVTAVNALDIYEFSDTNIDFDVNAQLLPGLAAKVTFNTGQLAGYTFDISKFDNSTKKFTILKNKNETALDMPSALIHMSIGDEYVLTDIEMPLAYVQDAELLLQSKAQENLDLYCKPVYQYGIVCDPKYFRRNRITMNIGDIVWISDSELQIEKYIRIISLSKSLTDEYQYELQLGDVVPIGTLQQIVATQQGTAQAVQSVSSAVINNALLNGYLICPVAADTTGMMHLFVDSEGKIWKQ